MTAHLPRGFWEPTEEPTDEQVKGMAEFVIANKEHALGPDRYTPVCFGVLSPADQVLFTAAQLLDTLKDVRDDPEFMDILAASCEAACEDPDEAAMAIGANAICRVVGKVLALEKADAEDSTEDS